MAADIDTRRPPCILALFEAQVKRLPETRAAVAAESETLTYQALDARANRLAHLLNSRGIGAGARVGLCLERSLDMPVAVMGILKAGAAIVPLDPSYPQARRDFVARDAALPLIVTRSGLRAALPPEIPALCLDSDRDALAAQPADAPARPDMDSLCYIIYTSGSTGTPKGVALGRDALSNLIRWQLGEAADPAARTAQFAALGFDVSFQEIFATLGGGGTLVLVPEALRADPAGLVRFLDTQKVARLFLPFVALQQVAEEAGGQPGSLGALREVITAGEQLKITPAIRALFSRLPNCTLCNQYGPSETHVATAHILTGAPESWPALPPIGLPIANAEAWVLDEAWQPAPDGEDGELFLGGACLADGYWGRPDLTTERFVPHPFSSAVGARLYKTGDRVRRGAGGLLDFRGRMDAQVKIRGFRVEPGEAEQALLRFPAVRQAAVAAHEYAPGDTRLIAYVTTSGPLPLEALREFLEGILPEYLVPSAFVTLDALPLTPSGKVDRLALPPPRSDRPALAAPFAAPASGLEQQIAGVWEAVLGLSPVGAEDSFFDLGGRSLQMVQVHRNLAALLPAVPDAAELDIATLFQHPTVRALARHLTTEKADAAASLPLARTAEADIALVGMAGRFPGASDIAQFWENVKHGVESVTRFTDDALAGAGVSPALLQNPDYVKHRGVLDDADLFDAAFFGITPKDADVMDPQHRIFLECAWEALENAGYDPEAYDGAIGVWAGASLNTYLLANLCGSRADVEELVGTYQVGNYATLAGNDKDFLPTRVSYKLGLKGPSLAVGTGCSTSLVAVAQACQSLRSGDCDMALAGGVSVTFPQTRGYLYQEGGMVSPDGRCLPFDADARGTVFGGGAGIVVLKRLADALRDGDTIQAVIKGWGLNNDGAQKASYTAPSADGQAGAIRRAHLMANVPPETISYVEAHGTATPLGDPIELAGLTQAFRAATDKTGFCALGSAKFNVGHLEAASGVTGLIKTARALAEKTLPPSPYFQSPNPHIDFARSPFVVPQAACEWPAGDTPRRAGVSSFGVGGTNAHVVLEEAPPVAGEPEEQNWHLLPLSARTETALDAQAARLARHLRAHPETRLADAAYTLQAGRRAFAHRRMLVCRSREDAAAVLEGGPGGRLAGAVTGSAAPTVAFLFPGQGAQQVGMGRELYETEAGFRARVDECCDLLHPLLGLDLRETLYPAVGEEEAARLRLAETGLAQPALFVFEYALARLWMDRGVVPAAMLGHSVGEYVAACLAGVFTLPDALAVLAVRARLMQQLPPGAMLAVRRPAAEIMPLLGEHLSLAAVNSPALCVVSGPHEAADALEAVLTGRGIACRRLSTSHAFHSAMMDPILPAFREIVAAVPRSAPSVPFVSNVTGTWITDAQATDPAYWADHLRQAVCFAEGVGTLLQDPARACLEIGPGLTLSPFVRQHPARTAAQAVVASLDNDKGRLPDSAALLSAMGHLWLAGAAVDWSRLPGGTRRRGPLPTYPFERTRHWVEPVWENQLEVKAASPALPVSAMPMPTTTPAAPPRRAERLQDALRTLFQEQSGLPADRIAPAATFLDLGFDSLSLTQAATAVSRKFGVRVTFRTLLEEASTVSMLAAWLDEKLPPEALPAPVPAAPAPAAPAPTIETAPSTPMPSTLMERVIAEQLQVMAKQLDLLRGGAAPTPLAPAPLPPPAAPAVPAPLVPAPAPAAFGPYKPIEAGQNGGLTPRQQDYLDGFIARYAARTPASKRMTQDARPHLADPRAVAGFKTLWKEMVYPLVADRSEGSKIWDVDGNEYIDIAMGFGVGLLGHSPAFVTEALTAQLGRGVEIGPQSPLAGEVARLACAMTGMERATFCNTGSEAVMAALRAARTVTGRSKIVYFTGDYHGTFDEVLGRAVGPGGKALPVSPGIPAGMMDDLLILDYGTDESLATLREYADDLAAVLVEPVQSRRPDLQPREFLHEVRRITEESGTALIFDEVITGFRIHPGGAQAWFGVRADLATYGKVLGGGMPIGLVTGKALYMDAFDGGAWRYGDGSWPEAGVTFFAGTFVRHPLALAAAHAMLTHLQAAGPKLQEELNARTARFVDCLNAHFEGRGVPIRLTHFGSLFYFKFAPDLKWASLLFFHLRHKGIHVWEGRPCFLSTAHTDADLARLTRAFEESVAEMQAGGFLPESPADRPAPPPRLSSVFPLTEAQRGVWLTAQMGEAASCAFSESVVVHLAGPLDRAALEGAVQSLVDRHDALRTTLLATGEGQQAAPSLTLAVLFTDLSGLAPDRRTARQDEILEAEGQTPFDLEAGPLVRARIVTLEADRHFVVVTAHHLVCDGWSFGILLSDLAAEYTARCAGQAALLPPAPSFLAYAAAHQVEGSRAALDYWVDCLSPGPPPLALPTDQPRPAVRSYRGARVSRPLPPALGASLRRLGASEGCTLPATLLAAYTLLLRRRSGQDDFVVWVPAAGQSEAEAELVGHCVSLLPLRVPAPDALPFTAFLRATRTALLDGAEHQNYSLNELMQALDRPVPITTTFNVDRFPGDLGFSGLSARIAHAPRRFFQFDLGLNVIEDGDALELEADYSVDLFDEATVQGWLEDLHALLEGVCEQPALSVGALTASLPDPAPVAEGLTLSQAPEREFAAPRTPTEQALAALWQDLLGVPRVGAGDNFFALGGYSLLALRLYGRVEQELGVRLPLTALFAAPTLEALAAVVAQKIAAQKRAPQESKPGTDAATTLVPLRPGGGKLPLYCIHPDHGLVLFYQALANRLSPDQPVYGLQSVGLDEGETPETRIEDMAARYLLDIRRFQPTGPYHLGGYSLGGIIAAEMARQLDAQGEAVGLLALFDAYAPVAYQQNLIDKPRLRRLAGHWQGLKGKPPGAALALLREKAQEALEGKKPDWQKVAEDLSGAVAPERLDSLRQVILANESAFFGYKMRPCPAHATLFRAMEVSVFEERDPHLWWGETFTGGLEVHDVPGMHLTMMQEPLVQALAESLQSCLDQAAPLWVAA